MEVRGPSGAAHTWSRWWTTVSPSVRAMPSGEGDRSPRGVPGPGWPLTGVWTLRPRKRGRVGGPRLGAEAELHDAAFGPVRVRLFEAQPLLGPVLLQVGELLAVDGPPPLPGRRTGWGSGGTRPGHLPCPGECRAQASRPPPRSPSPSPAATPLPSTPWLSPPPSQPPDLTTSMVPTLPRPPPVYPGSSPPLAMGP